MNVFKQKYFLDTNIFLRVIAKENEQSWQECITLLTVIKQGRLKAVTSNQVLAEVAYVLKRFYKFPKEKIVRALKSIFALKGLKIIDGINTKLAVDLFSKHKSKLVDCFIASYKPIDSHNMSVISYDKDFDKLGVKRVAPKHLLKNFK